MNIYIIKRHFYWFTRDIWTVCYDVSKGLKHDKEAPYLRVIQNYDGVREAIEMLDKTGKLPVYKKDLTIKK